VVFSEWMTGLYEKIWKVKREKIEIVTKIFAILLYIIYGICIISQNMNWFHKSWHNDTATTLFDDELCKLTNYSIAFPEMERVSDLLVKYMTTWADMSIILKDQIKKELCSYSGNFVRVDEYLKWADTNNIHIDIRTLITMEITKRKANTILHSSNIDNISAYLNKIPKSSL
jgi:hypothetical protein